MFRRVMSKFHRRHDTNGAASAEHSAVLEGAHVVHLAPGEGLSARECPMPPPMGAPPRSHSRPSIPPLRLPFQQQTPQVRFAAGDRDREAGVDTDVDVDADVEDAGLDQSSAHPAAVIARAAVRRHRKAIQEREEREEKEAAAKKLAELEKKAQGVLEVKELSSLDRSMITRVTIWQLGIGSIISTVGIETGVSSCFSLTVTMFVASLFYLGLPLIHYEIKKDVKWYKRPISVFGIAYFTVSVLSLVMGLIPLGMGDFSHFRVYKSDNTTYAHNDVLDAFSTFFCILNAAFPLLTREFVMELGSYITNQYLIKIKAQLEELKEQLIKCQERSTRIYQRADTLIYLLTDAVNGVDRDYVEEIKKLQQSREHAQHAHGRGYPSIHADGECSYRRDSLRERQVAEAVRRPITSARDGLSARSNPYAPLDKDADTEVRTDRQSTRRHRSGRS